MEHDFEQCAHIFQKISQSHSQNHMGQNNLTKTHTTYLRGHWKKDVVNEPRQRQMSLDLNNICLKMEIINKRGEINFNKWMEKAKDFKDFIKWGYKCVRN